MSKPKHKEAAEVQALQADNERLRRIIKKQREQIEVMEKDLYMAGEMQTFMSGGLKDVMNKHFRERQELLAELEGLHGLLNDWKPFIPYEIWQLQNRETIAEMTGTPVLAATNEPPIWGFDPQPDGVTYINRPIKCLVDYRVVVLHGPNLDQMMVAQPLKPTVYPLPLEDLKDDLDRITNIIQCAPMPEDLPQTLPPTNLEGLSPETLHKALCRIAEFCYSEELTEKFRQALDVIFNTMIEPELDYARRNELPPDDRAARTQAARQAFNDCIRQTFSHMESYGRGNSAIRPKKAKAGRTRKDQMIWSQKS